MAMQDFGIMPVFRAMCGGKGWVGVFFATEGGLYRSLANPPRVLVRRAALAVDAALDHGREIGVGVVVV